MRINTGRGNGSSLPRMCLTVESGTGTNQWIEVMINPAWERGNDKPWGTGQGQATAPTTGHWNEWDRVKVLLHERFVIVNHIGMG
jgi:hypothetical protein